jgi:hypothetical protein
MAVRQLRQPQVDLIRRSSRPPSPTTKPRGFGRKCLPRGLEAFVEFRWRYIAARQRFDLSHQTMVVPSSVEQVRITRRLGWFGWSELISFCAGLPDRG